jgi:uncharacterized membrane-anchored protein YhcB (DUF1043 family)
MLTITALELVTMVVILPLAGGIIGCVVAGDKSRRASGGKTPVELKREFDDYQEGVTSHFQETAQLLQHMTEQYRAVYTHVARGAADLCGADQTNPQLEELKRLSLALDDAAAVAGEIGDVPADTVPDADADGGTAVESSPDEDNGTGAKDSTTSPV